MEIDASYNGFSPCNTDVGVITRMSMRSAEKTDDGPEETTHRFVEVEEVCSSVDESRHYGTCVLLGLEKVFRDNLDPCWVDEVQVRSQKTEPAVGTLYSLPLARLAELQRAHNVIGKAFEYLHRERSSEKQILKKEIPIRSKKISNDQEPIQSDPTSCTKTKREINKYIN